MMGAALGALCRYGLSQWLQGVFHRLYFPVGMFAVNVLGCLAIGFVIHLFDKYPFEPAWVRAFIIVGVLGGFTTFSSFAWDGVSLFHSGYTSVSLFYIVSSVLVCLAAAEIGFRLARIWI